MHEKNPDSPGPKKNSPENSPRNSPQRPKITDSIAVYTQLVILLRMRHELGLEAMLEYLDAYVGMVQCSNPELRRAVDKALSVMSVRQIYRRAFPKS